MALAAVLTCCRTASAPTLSPTRGVQPYYHIDHPSRHPTASMPPGSGPSGVAREKRIIIDKIQNDLNKTERLLRDVHQDIKEQPEPRSDAQ